MSKFIINKAFLLFVVTLISYTMIKTAVAQNIMTPEQVVREIYDSYSPQKVNSAIRDSYRFNIPEKEIKKLFTTDFLSTLQKDINFANKTKGVGALDYDPICNCQDISDGIVINNIKIIPIDNKTVQAKVNFNILGAGDGKGIENYFYLKKIKNRWAVDNIVNIYKTDLRKDYN